MQLPVLQATTDYQIVGTADDSPTIIRRTACAEADNTLQLKGQLKLKRIRILTYICIAQPNPTTQYRLEQIGIRW